MSRSWGGGYEAALNAAAFLDRSDRGRMRVGGRAPVRMLEGILTSAIPGPERALAESVREGRALYSALLTPKGRMVSDLRVLRVDPGEPLDTRPDIRGGRPAGPTVGPAVAPGRSAGTQELLLDLPPAGRKGVADHLGTFVPPRFASVEDLTDHSGTLAVLGPDAPRLLSLHGLGLRVGEEELAALEEGEYRAVDAGAGAFLRVVRTKDVATLAFDLLGDAPTLDGIRRLIGGAGAVAMEPAEWDVLRVEAGRPAFGIDMDEDTIPMEVGLQERAIDHGKGCYTGQEVIVRIRDRGHVNRTLRGLLLGEWGERELPGTGTPLYAPEARGERPAGELRSVVRSPRMGAVALAYVRREVGSEGTVRVGSAEGPEARVVDLDGGGWGPG